MSSPRPVGDWPARSPARWRRVRSRSMRSATRSRRSETSRTRTASWSSSGSGSYIASRSRRSVAPRQSASTGFMPASARWREASPAPLTSAPNCSWSDIAFHALRQPRSHAKVEADFGVAVAVGVVPSTGPRAEAARSRAGRLSAQVACSEAKVVNRDGDEVGSTLTTPPKMDVAYGQCRDPRRRPLRAHLVLRVFVIGACACALGAGLASCGGDGSAGTAAPLPSSGRAYGALDDADRAAVARSCRDRVAARARGLARAPAPRD
jgi:hypothetical protein